MSAPQSAVYGRMPPCVISKAREDLPCLQRVKRARRNRRRMGVCPWQLVAESASFSAADYRAQASGEIFGKIPREFYTVCLATLTAYCPRAAGQRPVRLRSGYAAAPLRVTQKSRAAFFIISCASENHAFSSERSAAFSHCHKAAMLACALRSSSSQKSHFVAIFGSPFSAPLFGNTLPVAGKVNARHL